MDLLTQLYQLQGDSELVGIKNIERFWALQQTNAQNHNTMKEIVTFLVNEI